MKLQGYSALKYIVFVLYLCKLALFLNDEFIHAVTSELKDHFLLNNKKVVESMATMAGSVATDRQM